MKDAHCASQKRRAMPALHGTRQGTMKELILRVKEAIEFWVEEMESVRAYDTAKAGGGEIIPFEQAVFEIEQTLQDIYH
jgi:hypothetical protein